MKEKKSWDKKWYTEEFLNELKQTQYTEMCGSLTITVKYAPDAVSPLGIDPRLLGGPMGKTAKSMRLLPEFVIKRIKIKFNEKMLRKNSLYYTEKNFRFVRVFFKILYTLFTFDFTIEKIPLYNTEKNSSFIDVFLEKYLT